jgi:hypothetical protein
MRMTTDGGRNSVRHLLLLSVLALLLTACGRPAATAFTEELGIDLLFRYDAPHITPEEKMQLLAGAEKRWYELYLEDRQAGRQPRHPKDWTVHGAVARLERVSRREALMLLQYPSRQRGGQSTTVYFRFIAVDGDWKIENHQTPDGRWWKP